MATSVCCVAKLALGNNWVHVFSATVGADKTMQFHTGFSIVKYHLFAPISCTTMSGMQCFKNQGAAGTALAGYMAVTGGTSGDDYTIVAFG